MKMLTNEEIFYTVKDHLLAQNEKSTAGPYCKYRLGNLRCAIGCLVIDDVYKDIMEDMNIGIFGLFNHFPNAMRACGLKKASRKLLATLQLLHDYNDPGEWNTKLDDCRKKFKIKKRKE